MFDLNLSISILTDLLNSYNDFKDKKIIKDFYKFMQETCKNFNLQPEEIHKMIMEVRQ
ncbi:hypothetical protein J5751_05025 [bacterium]|nr:hypothetical protein [bacterium]